MIQSNSRCHQVRAEIACQPMFQVSQSMKAIWYDDPIYFDILVVLTYAHLIFSAFLTFFKPADHQGTQPLPTENWD